MGSDPQRFNGERPEVTETGHHLEFGKRNPQF